MSRLSVREHRILLSSGTSSVIRGSPVGTFPDELLRNFASEYQQLDSLLEIQKHYQSKPFKIIPYIMLKSSLCRLGDLSHHSERTWSHLWILRAQRHH